MTRLAVTLHLLGLHAVDALRPRDRRPERGSVTIEQVLWAVALIAIVGIVVVAIKGYVTSEAAKIK